MDFHYSNNIVFNYCLVGMNDSFIQQKLECGINNIKTTLREIVVNY